MSGKGLFPHEPMPTGVFNVMAAYWVMVLLILGSMAAVTCK